MQYAIRLARTTDLASIYTVSQVVHSSPYYDDLIPADFRKKYDSHYQKTDAHQQTFIAKMARRLVDSSWEVWVATNEQDVVVGYTLSHQVSPIKRLLKGLFVCPEAQGNGIGKALFRRSLGSAPAGCTIEFVVIATNTAAKQLYQKKGFVVSGPAKKPFYGAPQEVMQGQMD